MLLNNNTSYIKNIMNLNSNNVFIACLVLIIMMLSCQADKLFYKNKSSSNSSSNSSSSSNNAKNNFSGNYCLSNQDINNSETNQIYTINRNSPCHRTPSSNYKYKYQFKRSEKEKEHTSCKDPCPYLVNPHAEIPQSVKNKCGLDNSDRILDQNNGIQRDNLTVEDYKELLKKYENQVKIKTNTFKRN